MASRPITRRMKTYERMYGAEPGSFERGATSSRGRTSASFTHATVNRCRCLVQRIPVSISAHLVRLRGEIDLRQEERMQYLALIYSEEGRWASLSQEDRDRELGEYMALSQATITRGGNELDSVTTATTVRVRGDETLVTDGPFAESKEALGGYYVFECDSIDEACTWAAKIPAARQGAVEVRPVYIDPNANGTGEAS